MLHLRPHTGSDRLPTPPKRCQQAEQQHHQEGGRTLRSRVVAVRRSLCRDVEAGRLGHGGSAVEIILWISAAVVIDPIAPFGVAGEDIAVGVVAVLVTQTRAVAVDVLLTFREEFAIAVGVLAVALFRGVGGHRSVTVIAVPVAGGPAIAVLIELLVLRGAVAVVVATVAHLGVAREVLRVGVIAVETEGNAVGIGVDLIRGDRTIAIGVQSVTGLRGLGMHVLIAVVAVPTLGLAIAVADGPTVSIAVFLVAFQGPGAVVVYAIADLGLPGVHRRVAVQAVAGLTRLLLGVVALAIIGQHLHRPAVPVTVDVAVAGNGIEAVAILVDAVVHVDGQGFILPRVNGRIQVVAITGVGISVLVIVGVHAIGLAIGIEVGESVHQVQVAV